jgi:hypothetical protein
MKKLMLVIAGIAYLFIACKSQKGAGGSVNSVSRVEQQEGWKLLFDGKSKAGWHSYGRATAGQAWQVKDGAIYFDTSQRQGRRIIGGGDLVTNQEFENFHLKYEWKISPKGNSGVIFLTHEDTARYQQTYYTGLEMQVLDNDGHPDGKIQKHRAGDLYDLIKSSSEPVKAVGEWNQAEIVMNKGKLELYLNGTNVVTTTLWDDNWKQLVANSKFKAMTGFTQYKKGRICLQDHGNVVWFRNIKIKEL